MPRTKSHNRIYHRLMKLCKNNGGRLDIANTDMLYLIGGAHRAATQFSSIRRFEKMQVNAIRDGRRVIAYEMPAYQMLQDDIPEPLEVVPVEDLVGALLDSQK